MSGGLSSRNCVPEANTVGPGDAISRAAAIDTLLGAVRAKLPPRARPADLDAIRAAGGLVVDTRPAALRRQDGELPGAVVVERNVLEWRLDPTSPHRLAEVTGHDQPVVVVCDEGYASSLAAASLQSLGLRRATDLDGGYQAWQRYESAAGRLHRTAAAGCRSVQIPPRSRQANEAESVPTKRGPR